MSRTSTLSVLESYHFSAAGAFFSENEGDAGIHEVDTGNPKKASAFPDPESSESTASAFPESEHYSEFFPEPAIEYLKAPVRRSMQGGTLLEEPNPAEEFYKTWFGTATYGAGGNAGPDAMSSAGDGAGSDNTFTRRWMHPDHLGTASLISNDAERFSAKIVLAESITIYLPYGAVLSASLRESTLEKKSETGFRDPYGFTGKELEVDLGIMYFGARWYNPQLGRWLSPDPLYLVSTANNAEKDQNIYHYAGNNPWKFVDPDGTTKALVKKYAHEKVKSKKAHAKLKRGKDKKVIMILMDIEK